MVDQKRVSRICRMTLRTRPAKSATGTRHTPATGRTDALISVGLSTVATAVLGWALLFATGRILGPTRYAEFAVLWALYFALTGVFAGLGQETTRSLAITLHRKAPASQYGCHPLAGAAILTTVAVLALVSSSMWWAPTTFGTNWVTIVVATAIAIGSIAVFNVVNGTLAARGNWSIFASLPVADATIRLAACLVLAAFGVNGGALMCGIVTGSLCWAAFWPLRKVRAVARTRTIAPLPTFLRSSIHAMIATGCSALLITGFPLLLRVTSRHPLNAEAGVVLAAVMLTRAPLLIPLTSFQLVILRRLMSRRSGTFHGTTKLLVIGAASLAPAAIIGYTIGPWILRTFLGSEFQASRYLMAGVAIAAVCVAALTLTGIITLASGGHRAYTSGWITATAVTIVLLATPLTVVERTTLGLVMGPLAGIVIHLFAMRRLQFVAGPLNLPFPSLAGE